MRNPDWQMPFGIDALREARTNPMRLLTLAHDIARSLENYLNRHVLRRRISSGPVFGDTTDHSATAWTTVAPAVGFTYPKAAPDSVLVVDVNVQGFISAVTGTGWVEFGVRGLDPGGAVVIADTNVCRQGVTATGYQSQSGTAPLPVCPAGPVALELRVRVDAGTTTWTSASRSSMSVAVVETHAP